MKPARPGTVPLNPYPGVLMPQAAAEVERYLLGGVRVHVDPHLPADELRLVDEHGEVLLRVTGIGR